MNRDIVISLLMLALSVFPATAQKLKVNMSSYNNRVNLDAGKRVSTIVFKSTIKDLGITSNMDDEQISLSENEVCFLIEPESEDYINTLGYPTRDFTVKAPNAEDLVIKTPGIIPSTVTYYTITMPNQFPFSLSAEYLLTKSAKHGVRVSLGKQFGGYVSYKWGEYAPSGNNIADIRTDVDLSNSIMLGGIRKSITGGMRLGLIHKTIAKTDNSVYLLIGGGYGEYGRQWKNPTQIEGNIYFYSDYMKGFDGELALQLVACNWMCFSAGADMLVTKGKISVDYLIGVGLNINCSKLFKR